MEQQDNNMILRKALSLAFVYSRLTLENLEVAVHEMSVLKHRDAKRLKGYLNKLIEANQNAFAVLERNISQEEVEALVNDLNKLLTVSWEGTHNG